MAELTPMMKQYLEIKQQHQDCIVFFRLGDFYEMFAEDANIASSELDLTLTTRDRGKGKDEADRIPMCGIPYHSSESYIARLVAKGYKVAICEQMEDPATTKGLVKREITRIVTPGTVTESSMLDERRNNYFASLYAEGDAYGLCFCDISTGAFYATFAAGKGSDDKITNELGRFGPAEIICGGSALHANLISNALTERLHCCIDQQEDTMFDLAECTSTLTVQFGKSLHELGIESMPQVIQAAGALLRTLMDVQRTDLSHIHTLEFYNSGRFMELDLTARHNLELTETLRNKEKRGSLLWVLDKTKTAMGSRLLRSWLEKPLLHPNPIQRRLDAVDELVHSTVAREELLLLLKEVSDLERVMARIVTGSANCRDFIALQQGCSRLPELKQQLSLFESPMLCSIAQRLDPLQDCRELILRAIVDDPPFSVREGGMIRDGYNEEIDTLRDIMSGGKGMLSSIEAREKEKTGIKTMKVGYNRVFGYYIEVSKGQTALVPETYIRKQTLTNCERYITEELKELENTILSAKDKIVAMEYEQYTKIRLHLAEQSARVQKTAQAVAEVDVLACFAAIAVSNNYCKPEVDLSNEVRIQDGRHPVVEQMQKNTLFVPNDTCLGTAGNQVSIITGPNMAGKSTYMRQVALIVLMAQIGCFVPAKEAHIGVVDRLFTRIGASDDLASGQSTFMIEMIEVAEILNHATPRSLLILDEIGRGTSTFDGMAIARAVLEYVADSKKLGAKTLFATHYHELTAIEEELSNVKNYNIAVKKRNGEIIFLRKIVPGATDDSYGVEVAKLAGLPDTVIARARDILSSLEQNQMPAPVKQTKNSCQQISMLDLQADELREKLQTITLETLTPIEAMNVLYELKMML